MFCCDDCADLGSEDAECKAVTPKKKIYLPLETNKHGVSLFSERMGMNSDKIMRNQQKIYALLLDINSKLSKFDFLDA